MVLKKKSKTIIARIDPELYESIAKFASDMHLPLSALVSRGLRELALDLEGTEENLLKLVESQPSLILKKDLLVDIIKDARREVIKEMVHILKKGDVILYDLSMKEFTHLIPEINKKGIRCSLTILTVGPDSKPKEEIVDQVITDVKKLKCEGCRHFTLTLDKNIKEQSRILLFIKLKKEGENG
jgi:hypothetical protein